MKALRAIFIATLAVINSGLAGEPHNADFGFPVPGIMRCPQTRQKAYDSNSVSTGAYSDYRPVRTERPRGVADCPSATCYLLEPDEAVRLSNLQTNYLDCLVLHSPLANERQLMEVWKAMEAIFNDGGAKQLGISNCCELETA